jgi:hypothetical protein
MGLFTRRRYREINVPANTRVCFGRPAHPIPAEVSTRVGEMLHRIAGVAEGHLPQCYAPGVIGPCQILVVGILEQARSAVAAEIERQLPAILPNGVSIDFILLGEQAPDLDLVRRANCRIA